MTIRVYFKNGNMRPLTVRDDVTLRVLAADGAVSRYVVRVSRKVVAREFDGLDGLSFPYFG